MVELEDKSNNLALASVLFPLHISASTHTIAYFWVSPFEESQEECFITFCKMYQQPGRIDILDTNSPNGCAVIVEWYAGW